MRVVQDLCHQIRLRCRNTALRPSARWKIYKLQSLSVELCSLHSPRSGFSSHCLHFRAAIRSSRGFVKSKHIISAFDTRIGLNNLIKIHHQRYTRRATYMPARQSLDEQVYEAIRCSSRGVPFEIVTGGVRYKAVLQHKETRQQLASATSFSPKVARRRTDASFTSGNFAQH